MRAPLSNHRVSFVQERDLEKWPNDIVNRKARTDEEAYNIMILNLSYSVLREVDEAETPLNL